VSETLTAFSVVVDHWSWLASRARALAAEPKSGRSEAGTAGPILERSAAAERTVSVGAEAGFPDDDGSLRAVSAAGSARSADDRASMPQKAGLPGRGFVPSVAATAACGGRSTAG
jgi:hypothetical protein